MNAPYPKPGQFLLLSLDELKLSKDKSKFRHQASCLPTPLLPAKKKKNIAVSRNFAASILLTKGNKCSSTKSVGCI